MTKQKLVVIVENLINEGEGGGRERRRREREV